MALYEIGGVRGCEIGTVMFGRRADGSEQPAEGGSRAASLFLVVLIRKVISTMSVEVCEELVRRAPTASGYRIVDEPASLRHFTASFEPIAG